jgi:hypothetical protein
MELIQHLHRFVRIGKSCWTCLSCHGYEGQQPCTVGHGLLPAVSGRQLSAKLAGSLRFLAGRLGVAASSQIDAATPSVRRCGDGF